MGPELDEEPEGLGSSRRIWIQTSPAAAAGTSEDRVFPYAHAERFASIFLDAIVEPIADSYTFVSEDRPQRLAAVLRSFAATRSWCGFRAGYGQPAPGAGAGTAST